MNCPTCGHSRYTLHPTTYGSFERAYEVRVASVTVGKVYLRVDRLWGATVPIGTTRRTRREAAEAVYRASQR